MDGMDCDGVDCDGVHCGVHCDGVDGVVCAALHNCDGVDGVETSGVTTQLSPLPPSKTPSIPPPYLFIPD